MLAADKHGQAQTIRQKGDRRLGVNRKADQRRAVSRQSAFQRPAGGGDQGPPARLSHRPGEVQRYGLDTAAF
jgi:hypothetical protein